ncbi:MAG: GntR family transcriptional regulator [Proteobacteria bacterium]|nr:GntR family transcriptional regulator [Pseudomonadota bacterium]
MPRGLPPSPSDGRAASKPLSRVAYDSLRTMILSGEVRPGERLGERELARRIQVSRTPLREALGRLERDGLAICKPGVGYFALEFDPKVVAELYEFRKILEVHACRAAAKRIDENGIRELADIVKQLAVFERKGKLSLDQLREEVDLGIRIHEVIARESGNDFVRETLLQLYDRLRLLTWIDVLWVDKWPLTRKEHRDLVKAITARNGPLAAKIAERHVLRSRDDALRVIKARYDQGGRITRAVHGGAPR